LRKLTRSGCFSAKDLSILSPLDNEYIKDVIFQQDPDRIIWVLTESGKLLGLTFDKEQEVDYLTPEVRL
jgi:hypothetical protein